MNKVAACWTGGEICHVEVLVQHPCTGIETCPTCRIGKSQPRSVHTYSFSIVRKGEWSKVFLVADRNFTKNTKRWIFVKVPLEDEEVQASKALVFLQSQVESKFNTRGFWCNFLCICWPECLRVRNWIPCWIIGVRNMPKDADLHQMARNGQTWFCSEMISSMLQYIGVLGQSEVTPAMTSPEKLFCIAKQKQWAIVDHPNRRYLAVDRQLANAHTQPRCYLPSAHHSHHYHYQHSPPPSSPPPPAAAAAAAGATATANSWTSTSTQSSRYLLIAPPSQSAIHRTYSANWDVI